MKLRELTPSACGSGRPCYYKCEVEELVAQYEAEDEQRKHLLDYIWDEIYKADSPTLSVAAVEKLRRYAFGGER